MKSRLLALALATALPATAAMAAEIGEGIWADTSTVADEVQVKFRIFLVGEAGINVSKK